VCGVRHPGGADAAIAQIAGVQDGAVARDQLIDAGVGRRAIAHRLARSRLHLMHPRVYLVGHSVATPRARKWAAVLACGEEALLSHASAAELWGFAAAPVEVHVTVAGRRRDHLDGVRVHCVRALSMTEVRRRQGLPVTSPARTLLDFAEVAPLDELEQAVAEARRSGLVRDGELEAQVERSPGRHGVKPLRALLKREGGPAFTRSKAEQCLLALIRRARLAPPRCNVPVAGHEVDFLWPTHKLVVEFDSWEFHRGRGAFEKDRRRDADLLLAGYRVLRITWRRLAEEPEAVIAQIATALAERRPSSRP
jgi:very-short-patch-repair endonuclease